MLFLVGRQLFEKVLGDAVMDRFAIIRGFKIERARVEFIQKKMVEIGHAMDAPLVWTAPFGPGSPGAHHQGGARMGANPKESVVNKYSQSWDIPNLFVLGSSTFPSQSSFNPTLTIEALAFMSADAIVNRYRKNPGALL